MSPVVKVKVNIDYEDDMTELGVEIGVNHPGAQMRVGWKRNGKIAHTTSISAQYTVRIAVLAQDQGVSASVTFDTMANSSASANFSFVSVSDSAAVTYDPP